MFPLMWAQFKVERRFGQDNLITLYKPQLVHNDPIDVPLYDSSL